MGKPYISFKSANYGFNFAVIYRFTSYSKKSLRLQSKEGNVEMKKRIGDWSNQIQATKLPFRWTRQSLFDSVKNILV